MMIEKYRGITTAIRNVQNPKRLEENLFQQLGQSIDQTDRDIARAIMGNLKYRITASFFLETSDITAEQKLGGIFFIGLVNMSDDHMDRPGYLRNINDPRVLRKALLSQKTSVLGETIMLDKLLDRTLNKFPPEKQALINEFLENVLQNETNVTKRYPGTYDYQSAITYRENTSVAYTRAGIALMDVTDEQQEEELIVFARAFQMIDDAMDIISDWQNSAINPLIALAHEEKEGSVLAQMGQAGKPLVPKSFLDRIVKTRSVLKRLPKSRSKFKEEFNEQLKALSKGPAKLFLGTFGRIIF